MYDPTPAHWLEELIGNIGDAVCKWFLILMPLEFCVLWFYLCNQK